MAQSLLNAAGVRGVLVGGIAVAYWSEPRFTNDADFLVELLPEGIEAFLAQARRLGVRWDDEEVELLSEGGFMRLQPGGVEEETSTPIDILVADSAYLVQSLDRAEPVELLGQSVSVIAVEDLFLLKLIAFRPQDTLDLDTLWEACSPRMDMKYLSHWAGVLGVDRKLSVFSEPLPTDSPSEDV